MLFICIQINTMDVLQCICKNKDAQVSFPNELTLFQNRALVFFHNRYVHLPVYPRGRL